MPYSRVELARYAKEVGRTPRTISNWVAKGCLLEDPASLNAFKAEMERKKSHAQQSRERRGLARPLTIEGEAAVSGKEDHQTKIQAGNGDGLSPIGRRGAAAALERLEAQEERAHARLEVALARGNPLAIDAAQTFWLKCSETLRRLDLAVEVARRQEETQIPLKTAQDAVLATAEWLRIAISQFLSSEGTTMTAGFPSVGEFKVYFWERFRGILDLTVKAADKTNSAIPDWAKERIKTAWNVQD